MYFEPGINSSIEYIICKFKQLRKTIYSAIDVRRLHYLKIQHQILAPKSSIHV